MELVISITLVSFVVLLLSMAMRSGLRAYERAKVLGERTLLVSSVINLLDRQLAMVVSGKNAHTKSFVRFEGDEHTILFTTTASPNGAGGGGVIMAYYKYDQDKEGLIYCQKILTRRQDMGERPPDEITQESIDEERENGWDCTIVEGMDEVAFRFTGNGADQDIESWNDRWATEKKLPFAVGIRIKDGWIPFLLSEAVN